MSNERELSTTESEKIPFQKGYARANVPNEV